MTTPAGPPYGSEVWLEVLGPAVDPRQAGTRRTSRNSDESFRDERTAVLARIIIGLGITVIFFGIAGRRFYWLSKLIRSGQPAPRRWQGFRKVSETEVVEVAGQKKLLKWTVPGLAHFFTMWGFTVLMTTILEAYGSLFQSQLPHPAHRSSTTGSVSRRLLSRPQCSCRSWCSPSSE